MLVPLGGRGRVGGGSASGPPWSPGAHLGRGRCVLPPMATLEAAEVSAGTPTGAAAAATGSKAHGGNVAAKSDVQSVTRRLQSELMGLMVSRRGAGGIWRRPEERNG